MKVRAFCFATALLLLAILLSVPTMAAELILHPYGSPNVRYQFFDGDIPGAVYALTYDDSSWPVGPAPFGSDGMWTPAYGLPPIECQTNPATVWDPHRLYLVLRIWVDVPEDAQGFRVSDRDVSNSELMSINGIGWGSHTGNRSYCPWQVADYWPSWSYLHRGRNLIVVSSGSGFPYTGFTYLDVEIATYMPTVANEPSTWGRTKALFR